MARSLPDLVFDERRATPWFPKPVVKYAVLVPFYDGFPIFIKPEWDGNSQTPQVFVGSFYLIVDSDGRGRYGSAKLQWENMHRRLPADRIANGLPLMAWVKTGVPVGYLVDRPGNVISLLADPDGSVREARKPITAGTLLIRQPGGELQHVRPEDQDATYYPPAEARQLGLPGMSAEAFADWAVQQALSRFAQS